MVDIYDEDECCNLTNDVDRFYSVEDYASYMIINNDGIIDTNDISDLSKAIWYEWKLSLERVDGKVRNLIRYMLKYQYLERDIESAQYIAVYLTQTITDLHLEYEGDSYDNNSHSLFWNNGLSDIFTRRNYQKIYLEERKKLNLESVSPVILPYDIENIVDFGIYELFTFLENNAENEDIRQLLSKMLEYKNLFTVVGR